MAILKEYKVYNGADNMRIDSELLEEAISGEYKEPIIRFYGWEPACVSFGRNQKSVWLITWKKALKQVALRQMRGSGCVPCSEKC